ncbi:MAG: FadR/GntR family transcriptional regulator [Rhodobacterales bacterium]
MKNATFEAALSQAAAALAGTGTRKGERLHDRILNKIGQSIVSRELTPGDQLPNAEEWSAAHGVSRTVLREVIKVLAGKGLVEARPRTGTCVRPRSFWNFLDADVLLWRYGPDTTAEDARSLFELRRAIEPAAGALAAQRATPEQIGDMRKALEQMRASGDDGARFAVPDLVFHQTLLRMSGNELIGSLAAWTETALLISVRLTDDNPAGQAHSVALHEQVLHNILAADPAATSAALVVLLDLAEEDVRRSLEARLLGQTVLSH